MGGKEKVKRAGIGAEKEDRGGERERKKREG